MFFEILRIDGFSTDRIIYDKIANIEAIESKLINFSKEFSMKYLIEQKRKCQSRCSINRHSFTEYGEDCFLMNEFSDNFFA